MTIGIELEGTLGGASLLVPLGMSRGGHSIPGALACVHADGAPDLWAARHSFLHPDEIARAESFPSQARRQSFVLGRYAGKRAAQALGGETPLAQLEIVSGVFGQPILRGGAHPPVVSISHTARAAVAVACPPEHILAIDVEELSPRMTEVFESMLTERELARARAVGGPATGPNVIWSMKEALSKALRCGLTTTFEVLETKDFVLTGPAAFATLFSNFAQYRSQTLVLGDHVLSLAYPKNSRIELAPDDGAALERVLSARR
jgi:4'-phosphopantetheinyl transferase